MSTIPVCKSAGVTSTTSAVLPPSSKNNRFCGSNTSRGAGVSGVGCHKSFLVDADRLNIHHSHQFQRNLVVAHARGRSGRSEHRRGEDGLPSSLYVPFERLPPEGRTVNLADETCDPEERRCKTPIYVWERKCKACYGTGMVSSRSRRGNRSSYPCLSCHGIGYVRRASSTVIPDPEEGEVWTLGREDTS